jgi:hypothetical protein
VRALAVHREVTAMANAPVGLNFDQAPDIHLNLLAEIAFDAAFLLDDLADVIDFIFRQVANLFGVIDVGLFRDFDGAVLTDAINGGQPNPKALLRRKINTCNACHIFSLPQSLSLALLVLRIGADYAHHPAAMNHLALIANLFDACPDFHYRCSLLLTGLKTRHYETTDRLTWKVGLRRPTLQNLAWLTGLKARHYKTLCF